MKRAPLTYCPPVRSKEKLARLREIERNFHVRAFGEELARVNLDFTMEERLSYLEWMRELARQNGVPEVKRFPFYLEDNADDPANPS
jgi:hypothetical protein